MTKSLIQRLEEASEGARELDAKIAILCVPEFSGWIEHPANNGNQFGELAPSRAAFDEWLIRDGEPCLVASPAFTTSLDAALALAERLFPDLFWDISCHAIISGVRQHQAEVFPEFAMVGEPSFWGHASTPAIALCIAILKAKESHNV